MCNGSFDTHSHIHTTVEYYRKMSQHAILLYRDTAVLCAAVFVYTDCTSSIK